SHGATAVVDGNTITVRGQLSNGLNYQWQLMAVVHGGKIESRGASLAFNRCNDLILILSAGTDYKMDAPAHFRGEDPRERVSGSVLRAAQKGYELLKAEH